MAGVAVAVATTTPPDATATLQAMQSCRRESAALERLDCYDRLLAPLSPSGFDGALVKAGFVGEAWTRATEQEKRREGNTTELLVTQVPGERPTVVTTTPAIGHVPPRPVLMFSCVDNITRMQVALMHPLDVHDIAVTLNADSRALRSHWFVRENGTLLESSRGLSGIDEIKQLFGAKTLTVDTGADNAAGNSNSAVITAGAVHAAVFVAQGFKFLPAGVPVHLGAALVVAAGAAHPFRVEGDAGPGVGHGAFFAVFHGWVPPCKKSNGSNGVIIPRRVADYKSVSAKLFAALRQQKAQQAQQQYCQKYICKLLQLLKNGVIGHRDDRDPSVGHDTVIH